MSSTNAGNDNELKQLRVELSQANSDKARLEKENMKQKREVRAMTVGSREGTRSSGSSDIRLEGQTHPRAMER